MLPHPIQLPRARRLVSALAVAVALLAAVGTAVAVRPATAATTRATTVPVYWMAAADGGVWPLGGAPQYGNMAGRLVAPSVGMVATPDDRGYWIVAADGGVFSFGDAGFHGSTGGMRLNRPVVGMAPTPSGHGYWLVASDGGVFAFGDAGFYGSTGAMRLNRPVIGMVATPTGHGYWLVAADGGVFSFGDAAFHGSLGSLNLVAPIVAVRGTPDGRGYLMAGADGGVFAFGDARFEGSAGGTPIARPIVGMTVTPSGNGYWLTDADGLVYYYGDAGYYGSPPPDLISPIVGMATASGNGSLPPDPLYPHGAYGYDISNWQCGGFPPPPHQIGVVEVAGAPFGDNPCLGAEAAWAGAGLNLYIFLADNATGCGPNQTCFFNYGLAAAQDAFAKARAAGVDTNVTWWLDVEDAQDYWTGVPLLNQNLIFGAVTGLKDKGVVNVGLYTSVLTWDGIVGQYAPPWPVWAAWYTGNPQANCSDAMSYAAANGVQLPTGGVWMTQYDSTDFDLDYAC